MKTTHRYTYVEINRTTGQDIRPVAWGNTMPELHASFRAHCERAGITDSFDHEPTIHELESFDGGTFEMREDEYLRDVAAVDHLVGLTIDEQNDGIRAVVADEMPRPIGGFESAEDEDVYNDRADARFLRLSQVLCQL